ncbi:thioredoxin family protein [Emticicia soli]|uniref:Thioredoxin family protein n=1 Tax=Emticicia soli TaxID=2027878 RepID=A0ABW5J1W4_9BACT
MKIFIAILLIISHVMATAQSKFVPNPQAVPKQATPTLAIGAKAPDFNLPATDGKHYSLKDFASAKVLVVIFTCTHCPTAQAYEDRIKAIVNDYKSKGVAVVAISPNSPISVLLEELGYTNLNDDFENMAIRAKDKDFNFPYLYDGDTHSASVHYGPVATPHAFVFDKERILKYNGRLDAIEKPGQANAEDLRAAIDATLAGKEVATPTTKTFGCSVKWAWNIEYKPKTRKTGSQDLSYWKNWILKELRNWCLTSLTSYAS